MKRALIALLALLAVFSLAACSSEPAANNASAETTATNDNANTSAQSVDGKMLVAYFSWSGNTEKLAQMIQQETGADLYEIAPETPYTDDYDALLDQARQEQQDDARPALADTVDNWDDYDIVFVGYPDWWSDAPMLIYSFLESYDWDGKTLVPFCTSGGSGFGQSLDHLPDSAPGATILDGLHVLGDDADGAADDVHTWLADSGLV